MKKDKKSPTGKGKRVELDAEVVADLEATDAETEAIKGGLAPSSVPAPTRSVRW